MKNTSLITKLITVFITLALVVYALFQSWNYFTASVATTKVYTYCAERSLTLDGYVVRDEEVIDCAEPLLELTRAEGERVAKGQSLATVYGNEQALSDARSLSVLREQLDQLRAARTAASDAETALRLDTEIARGIVTLRAALTSGSYASLNTDVSSLKNTVLRREYAYRGASGLDERIESLEGQIASAAAALKGVSRSIPAPFSGTYSALADGWEATLRPSMLDSLTPSAFHRLAPVSVQSSVGKLIRGETWYYAALIAEADADGLEKGAPCRLLLSGLEDGMDVTVSVLTPAQDGERLLVLKSDRRLAAVTSLRSESAELIVESTTGLRIPPNVLRIDENGREGVYCLIGRTACFKPVEIVYQGADYCLVLPAEIDSVARESDKVLYTLRPGDEVLTAATDLYNGKVVR